MLRATSRADSWTLRVILRFGESRKRLADGAWYPQSPLVHARAQAATLERCALRTDTGLLICRERRLGRDSILSAPPHRRRASPRGVLAL